MFFLFQLPLNNIRIFNRREILGLPFKNYNQQLKDKKLIPKIHKFSLRRILVKIIV